MNHYSIFFTYEDQVLELPHNPETMPVELGGENQQYNVLGIGPITVPRTPKQKRIQIESYFPHDAEILPETYIKFFQDAMYEQRILVYTPVRAYEDGTSYTGGDDGFQCLVENFTTEERGGETGDFYYSLEIVEYRDYSPTIIEVRPVQTGYALSSGLTRTSDGVQVGDYVNVSGTKYLYGTDTPIGEAVNEQATVVRKGLGYYTVKSEDYLNQMLEENAKNPLAKAEADTIAASKSTYGVSSDSVKQAGSKGKMDKPGTFDKVKGKVWKWLTIKPWSEEWDQYE